MLTLPAPQILPHLQWTASELAFLDVYKDAGEDALLKLLMKAIDHREREIIRHLVSRQQVKFKLPSFFKNIHLVYPPKLSLEQSSSEATAAFKASLFSGQQFIDLTTGMGIDSMFFARQFSEGILVEQSASLAAITAHNLALIHLDQLKIAAGMDALTFLKNYTGHADLIYIDPARRDRSGGKVFQLSDCEPDVLSLLPLMFGISDTVVIKTSPLLDIRAACTQLKFVEKIYVLAVENECKELVFVMKQTLGVDMKIHAVNIQKGRISETVFSLSEETSLPSLAGPVQQFLYEPNAAIMKSGAFKSVAHQYGLTKLHQHTHLYTSAQCLPDFPGRIFEVVFITKVSKHDILTHLPDAKANISLRNFPGSVETFRKKMAIRDGGERYVFATTLHDDSKAVLICRKVVEGSN